MDPLTHGALGAAVAGLLVRDRDDVSVPALGALAGALPDIDIIPSLFLGPMSQLDLHRGITHSILFALLAAPVLGFFISRHLRKKNDSARFIVWSVIMLLCILTHVIMDCFTSYGTRIFLPFSDYRVAWGTIAVVDPLFSIPLSAAAISLFMVGKNAKIRRRVLHAGLSICMAYLAATIVNKAYVDSVFKKNLDAGTIEYARLMTTPLPLTNFLWVGIAEGHDYYFTGYYSLLDPGNAVSFERDRKNHEYIRDIMDYGQIQKLISFSKDFYTIEPGQGSLVFNDLRYGSMAAVGGEKEFMFSYIIKNNSGNLEIIRRARSRITPVTMSILIKRIFGGQVSLSPAD